MTRYLLLMLAIISLRVNCQNIFTSLDSALVACYMFSGNTNDMSGNNLHGNATNVTLVADRFGTPNSAYSFGGYANQGNIVIPGFSSYLNGNGVAISFWTSKSGVFTDAAFLLVPDLTGNRLSVSPYYSSAIYWDYGNISGGGRLMYPTSPLPASNTWDHWVFTANNIANTMKVYKNGVLYASKTGASAFNPSPLRDLCIGGGPAAGGSSLWYNGKLDDIRIYKRELLADEAAYIYNNNMDCSNCPAVTTPTITSSNSTLCAGASLTITATGSPTLNWYSSATSYATVGTGSSYPISSINLPGTYTNVVRTRNGCNTSIPVPVVFTVFPIPTVIAGANVPMLCVGQTAQLTGFGATSFTWLPQNVPSTTVNVSPTTGSTYTLIGLASGCTNTTTIVMPVYPLPSVSIALSKPVVCLGNTVVLSASGASSYTWSPGNLHTSMINISPLSSTTYTLAGYDGFCTNTMVISVPVVTPPVVSISGNTIICLGTTANLLANGAINYTWSPGNIQSQLLSISPTSDVSYTVTGEISGCMDTAVISMSVVPSPTVSIAATATTICPGELNHLSASGANTYSWNNGNNTPSIAVSPSATTNYSVIGFSINNCSASAVYAVNVHTVSPIHIAASSSIICRGESILLKASGADSYTWNTGSQSDTLFVSPENTKTYMVTGTDPANGCFSSQSFIAQVDECAGISHILNDQKTINVFPNPNNGSFRITGSGKAKIISQSGQIIRELEFMNGEETLVNDLSEGLYFVIGDNTRVKMIVLRN